MDIEFSCERSVKNYFNLKQGTWAAFKMILDSVGEKCLEAVIVWVDLDRAFYSKQVNYELP